MKFSALVLAGSLLVPVAGMAKDVNDAQIAAIVVTANQVDIDAGKLAANTTHNADVKSFACILTVTRGVIPGAAPRSAGGPPCTGAARPRSPAPIAAPGGAYDPD